VLESHNQIVSVADDDQIARCLPFPPCFHPLIEYVVQIDIRQQRRYYRPLRSAYLCLRPLTFLTDSRLQPFMDQTVYSRVGDTMLDELLRSFVAHVVKGPHDTLPIFSTFPIA